MKTQCTGSDMLTHTSDYNVMFKKAPCPVCGKQVKISGANKDLGKVKISKHSATGDTK